MFISTKLMIGDKLITLSAHSSTIANSVTSTRRCDRTTHFPQAKRLMLDELADVDMARWISSLQLRSFFPSQIFFLSAIEEERFLSTVFYQFSTFCAVATMCSCPSLARSEKRGQDFTCKLEMPTMRKNCQAAIEFRAGTGRRGQQLLYSLLATGLNTNYKGCPPRTVGSLDDPIRNTHIKSHLRAKTP